MTRDDINRIAVAAGFPERRAFSDLSDLYLRLERFAALVVAAEREACAKVCDEQGVGRKALEHYAALTYSGAAHDCAAAIRARRGK